LEQRASDPVSIKNLNAIETSTTLVVEAVFQRERRGLIVVVVVVVVVVVGGYDVLGDKKYVQKFCKETS
jgi:hypothetical protein